jgi:lysophospholipase L1-like esterase
VPPPTITCPAAPPPVVSGNGQSAVVTFASAIATGGAAPVTVSCTPASGSEFKLGSTPVTCTATDAAHRTASCSFAATVTLPPPPRLGVTTILAFGDSITEGEVPVPGEFLVRPRFIMQDAAYPAGLTTLLAGRYTAQGASRVDAFTVGAGNTTNCATDPPLPMAPGIVVINAGCLGEHAGNAATLARLNDKISAYHPDVLLLLEGVNDLDPSKPDASIAAGVQGVRALIALAQSRNVRVLAGTLLPEIRTELTHGGAPELVVPFNAQLVPIITNAGGHVVDLYSDMARDVTDWISPYDGLHPTAAGYQEMATVWFAALRSAYELPPGASVTTSGNLRPRTVVRR